MVSHQRQISWASSSTRQTSIRKGKHNNNRLHSLHAAKPHSAGNSTYKLDGAFRASKATSVINRAACHFFNISKRTGFPLFLVAAK